MKNERFYNYYQVNSFCKNENIDTEFFMSETRYKKDGLHGTLPNSLVDKSILKLRETSISDIMMFLFIAYVIVAMNPY